MLGVYAVTFVIFLVLFWLKAVPVDVIWYGAELTGVWLVLCGALDFIVTGKGGRSCRMQRRRFLMNCGNFRMPEIRSNWRIRK